jgi:hypothetical protein
VLCPVRFLVRLAGRTLKLPAPEGNCELFCGQSNIWTSADATARARIADGAGAYSGNEFRKKVLYDGDALCLSVSVWGM